MRYIVFDVETPNRANDRMSAIGITVIEGGRIADSFFSLVDPETHFDRFNTQLTGISASTVQGAPNFPALWQRIAPLMSSGILVAHNAVFDMGVLKKCLQGYGIPLDHHKADSDARACAEILLRYLQSGADVTQFIRTYRLT